MALSGLRKWFVYAVVVNFLAFGTIQAANAAMITTQAALATQERELRVAQIQLQLARNEVQQQMIQWGVDPAMAQQRVASLTDSELLQLESQMQQLPAGGGALGVIGAVFLVLLILELVGVTDIFKKL